MNLLERLKKFTTGTPQRLLISFAVVALLLPVVLLVGVRGRTMEERVPAAHVYLSPKTLEIDTIGETGTVEVMLEGASESVGFQFELIFDQSVIRVDEITLPTSSSDKVTIIPLKDIRNEEGKAVFGVAALCEESCPNVLTEQSATMATLTVSAVGKGESALEFNTADYILYGTRIGTDNVPAEIPATLTGGRVGVKATPR